MTSKAYWHQEKLLREQTPPHRLSNNFPSASRKSDANEVANLKWPKISAPTKGLIKQGKRNLLIKVKDTAGYCTQ